MSKQAKKGCVLVLRFPEFSKEWEEKKLKDFIIEHKGGAPLEPKDFVSFSEYEVIPKKAITKGGVLQLDEREPTFCSEDFFNSYPKSIVDNYYLITTLRDLVPTAPSIGYIVKIRINKSYILAQGVYGLKIKTETLLEDFLIHFSNTDKYREVMKTIKVGSTQVHIRNNDFFNITIFVPCLLEQQKIAACLSSLDELITAQAQKVEALKTHKKGLMQQLFPAEGETVPKLRFPEFREAGEWKNELLDNLAIRGSGHTPNKKYSNYYNGGIKWVSLADSKRLDKGEIFETEIEISEEGLKNSSAVLHPKGSVLLSRDAGVGKSAVMASPMAVSQHFIAWIPKDGVLLNWFLYYILQIKKKEFEQIAIGSTVKTIGLPYFKNLTIFVPSLKEQQKIAACLSSLDELITAQAQKLEALKTHKKGLMQQLFSSTDEIN